MSSANEWLIVKDRYRGKFDGWGMHSRHSDL